MSIPILTDTDEIQDRPVYQVRLSLRQRCEEEECDEILNHIDDYLEEHDIGWVPSYTHEDYVEMIAAGTMTLDFFIYQDASKESLKALCNHLVDTLIIARGSTWSVTDEEGTVLEDKEIGDYALLEVAVDTTRFTSQRDYDHIDSLLAQADEKLGDEGGFYSLYEEPHRLYLYFIGRDYAALERTVRPLFASHSLRRY